MDAADAADEPLCIEPARISLPDHILSAATRNPHDLPSGVLSVGFGVRVGLSVRFAAGSQGPLMALYGQLGRIRIRREVATIVEITARGQGSKRIAVIRVFRRRTLGVSGEA
ncbi:hypothetical protein [Caulobacter sp. Root487D2Y]|uniref:hypothetical protein n=1 Tax=Caulobacter sp. Root487D2Y TaxID=1736547 RepID=UPI00138F69C5|nr:hypothetical protein [Caulobacter sp. Root487D2Y]